LSGQWDKKSAFFFFHGRALPFSTQMAPSSNKVTSESSISDTRTPVEKRKDTIANNKLNDLALLRKQEAAGKSLFHRFHVPPWQLKPLLFFSQTADQTNCQG
jgi:hypothetical protein